MTVLNDLFQRGWVGAWIIGRVIRNSVPDNAITTSEQLDAWFRLGGEKTKSGQRVTPETAMQQATVYACVRVLAETIAHLPLVLYRRAGDRREPDRSNPLFRLLHDRPNEWQTSFEWREMLVRDLELRGNHYSLIVRGFGQRIVELVPLHPDRVTPKQDRPSLEVTYDYTRPDGSRVTYRRADILHVRGMGADGVVGKGTVQDHRETIGDALAIQEHGSRLFSNGAFPSGVLHQNAPWKSEAAQEAFRLDWESRYQGGENAHRTAILPGNLEYKPLSLNMRDAQFIEARGYSRTEICALFRVPPHKVGDLTRATFSNIEHQALEFVIDSLMPRMVRIEQACGRDLLADRPDSYVKHNVDALLRGDAKSRAEALQIKRRNGVVSANEWRAFDDMNPREDEGGDEYIVESNMQPQDGAAPDQQTE